MNFNITFGEYNEVFLQKSWEWLNNPIIKNLTNTPNFTKEEQMSWFQTLKNKKDYFIRGVYLNNIPIGVVGLKKINNIDAEYWGYIGESNFWGQGIGSQMMNFAIKKAKDLSLQKIYLTVLNNNQRAKKLYQKFGFKQFNCNTNKNNKLIYMELFLEEK